MTTMQLEYRNDASTVTSAALRGFFVGWPSPPSPERHLQLLRASTHVVLALEGERVVGFVTAISDGVLSAYIPMLEVLPEYQRRGVGSQLVRRMLARLTDLYMVDLACDADLVPYYERLGLTAVGIAMGTRKPEAIG